MGDNRRVRQDGVNNQSSSKEYKTGQRDRRRLLNGFEGMNYEQIREPYRGSVIAINSNDSGADNISAKRRDKL